MAITAAQLMVRVSASTKEAEAALGSLGGMLSKAGPIAIGGAIAGAAVVGVGVLATKMAGDFQSGMTTLVTGAGEAQGSIGLVSQGILQMATDTGTTTKQLTDGMFMIESAGYHGKAGLDVLTAAAEGAKVGNADLGTVADATTTIMKDFSDQGVTATQAVNSLVATVANGKTHMEDLGQSLAHVLPTASAAGVGLNDVMGAMATMTGEGVDAANAATYLRQTILALDAPSSQAKKALEDIGLSTDQVSSTMQKSLPAALQLITDHLSKKFKPGSAEYIAALKDIVGGSKEIQGVLDLTGNHAKDFKTNVDNITGAVKKGGTQVSGWTDVQKTMNFQMDRAKAAVEEMGIKLGTKLLPVATQLFTFIANTAVPALTNFAHWITGSSTSAEIIRPILITLAIAIGGALVASFVAWAIAAGAAAIATIAATWPILAIGAGIALLIAGIILLVTHWKQVTAFLEFVWKKAMYEVRLGILEARLTFYHLKEGVTEVWNGIQGVIKGAINGVIGDINSFIRFIDGIKIHIPSIKIGPITTPALNWGGLGLPQIPLLAHGGIIDEAGSVLVGERGPELLGLPRGASVTPLPGSMARSGGAGGFSGAQQTIVIQLDSQTIARAAAKGMPSVIRLATGTRAF